MSVQTETAQVEAQAAQVEQEYRREEKRENKAMDDKLLAPEFNAKLITKAYGDNLSTGSVKSGGGDRQQQLPATLFFAHSAARVAEPIGEPILSGEYPYMDKRDKSWAFWMSSTNPNSHRLTDHDKCVVESFNHIIRHQNAAAAPLEQLLEHHQAIDADENTQAVMASVFTALQYIATANDSSKSVLDDFGQKWKHTPAQFDLNRKFARARAQPRRRKHGCRSRYYDSYKRQVNAYGLTSVYKRDSGQLVPKPADATKIDWREGSATRVSKPKKQVPQQQMAAASAPVNPQAGRGHGGHHPPATAPVAAVVVLP
jgi:hypothetical protein